MMGLGTFLDSDSTPTNLRGLLFMSLTDLGHAETKTVVSDNGGGGTASWTAGGTVPCRIDPLASSEQLAADRISDRSTHLITAPAGTSVSTAGRFVIATRGTFEITAVRERTGQSAQFFEAVEVS